MVILTTSTINQKNIMYNNCTRITVIVWGCIVVTHVLVLVASPVAMTPEERLEADGRSIYIGNVCVFPLL